MGFKAQEVQTGHKGGRFKDTRHVKQQVKFTHVYDKW